MSVIVQLCLVLIFQAFNFKIIIISCLAVDRKHTFLRFKFWQNDHVMLITLKMNHSLSGHCCFRLCISAKSLFSYWAKTLELFVDVVGWMNSIRMSAIVSFFTLQSGFHGEWRVTNASCLEVLTEGFSCDIELLNPTPKCAWIARTGLCLSGLHLRLLCGYDN